MRQSPCGLGLSVLVMSTCLASATAAPSLVTIDIPGARDISVWAINSRRDVVGSFRGAEDNFHGFLWTDGAFTVIDVPGAQHTELHGLNNRGDIVGRFRNAGEDSHGFLLQQGALIVLSSPQGHDLFPLNINDRGDIVGNYPEFDGFFDFAGFRLDAKGGFTSFTTLTESVVNGINNSGEMVGSCCMLLGPLSRGFVIDTQGTLTFLQLPGADSIFLWDINARGDIVGRLELTGVRGVRHSFLLDHRGVRFIDVPGALSTQVAAINARGDLAGTYTDNAGVHGFVLRE